MSKYITSVNLRGKIEDDPFDFVDDELTLDFWDWDGNFICSDIDWDVTATQLEVRLFGKTDLLFHGYMNLVGGFRKKISLGLDEKSNTGKLYFGTGLSRYDHKVQMKKYLTTDEYGSPSFQYGIYLPDDDSKQKYLAPEYFADEWRGARIDSYMITGYPLDSLLDYFFGDKINYLELPIWNTYGRCYYMVGIEYFGQDKYPLVENDEYLEKEKTILDFIKDICTIFNCILTYNSVTDKFYFCARRRTPFTPTSLPSSVVLNDGSELELKRSVNPSRYTSVEFVYTPRPDVRHNFGIPRLIRVDSDGLYAGTIPIRSSVFDDGETEPSALPNPEKVTFRIGTDTGSVLSVEPILMSYLYVKPDSFSVQEQGPSKLYGWYDPIYRLRLFTIYDNFIYPALDFIEPEIIYFFERLNYIPHVGAVFAIEDEAMVGTEVLENVEAGMCTDVYYKRESGDQNKSFKESVEIKVKIMKRKNALQDPIIPL